MTIIDKKFEKFLIRYSIISSVIVWVISQEIRDYVSLFINTLVQPLFSVDIDSNYEPDMEQLKKLTLNFFNLKFPIGNLIYMTIKILIELFIIYLIIKFIIHYTNFVGL